MLKKIYFLLSLCLLAIKPVLALNAAETSYVTELNDDQFESFIQSADKPVIVDFWAEWCNPCVKMKPVFEEVASDLKDKYLFVSVNLKEGPQTFEKYSVKSLPTFKVIKGDDVIGTFIGMTSKESFIERIDNIIEEKITINTLFFAIQTDDKELVEKCLKDKELDLNQIIEMNGGDISIPMTPLMMATSLILYGTASTEIVSMLVEAGADVDLEINFLIFDNSRDITDDKKISVRFLVKETFEGISEEFLATIEDEMVRAKVIECKEKASTLLDLIESLSPTA